MLETLKLIEDKKSEARALDSGLIDGRREAVRVNLSQIELKPLSQKYASRLAGISGDVYRKSRTEATVEWIGATALENPAKLARMEAFFSPLFCYTPDVPTWSMKNFWDADEAVAALAAKARKAFFDGDRNQARVHLCMIRKEVNSMLQIVNAMPDFEGMK